MFKKNNGKPYKGRGIITDGAGKIIRALGQDVNNAPFQPPFVLNPKLQPKAKDATPNQ